ncbi:MAG: GNAT family N-acetyltransferase [Pseudomonadota bacterium]
MQIPTIETDRLTLRAFRHDTDFESYAAFYASDLTVHYGGPLERAPAWRAAAAMMGHWVIRGYGPWAVEERATGDFCGMVGLWYPEGWPEREITWAIVESKQGKGFAAEAAKRAKRYAYETLGWQSVHSCISAGNAASIGLAEKLGATLEREVDDATRGRFLVYRHGSDI